MYSKIYSQLFMKLICQREIRPTDKHAHTARSRSFSHTDINTYDLDTTGGCTQTYIIIINMIFLLVVFRFYVSGKFV